MLKHAIFNGPFNVKLDRETIDRPKNYTKYYQADPLPAQIDGWRVQQDLRKEDGTISYGSIASGDGFEDTPDAEVICGGVNSKSPHSVSIGRHGNFLMWGFSGSPSAMTQSGRDVFANSIVYIADFDKQFPLQPRMHGGRDWWIQAAFGMEETRTKRAAWIKKMKNEGKSQAYLDRLDSPTAAVAARAKKLFPRLYEKFGVEDVSVYLREVLENRDYLYAELGDDRYGIPAFIDEDCLAYGIANHDPKLIDHCVELLESGDDVQRATRVLKRYTDLNFETAAQWRIWLDQARDSLYFTDTGGFKFYWDGQESKNWAAIPVPANSWGSNLHPVALSATVTPSETSPREATLRVRIQVDQGWHLYDRVPNDSPNAATKLTCSLPDSVQATGEWTRPDSIASGTDNELTLFKGEIEFSMVVSAENEADLSEKMFVWVAFQACTDDRCLPPERAFVAAKPQAASTSGSTADEKEEPKIKSKFIPTDISSRTKGFRPNRTQLNKNLKAVKTMPADVADPQVGSFKFGSREWLFLLDEPDGKPARLFVDANQDGDLTNDPVVDYVGKKSGEYTSYDGTAKLNWSDDQVVSIKLYRFDPKDERRASNKNLLFYYADFGHEYTLMMDGESHTTVYAGIPDQRITFEVNRDESELINAKLETVRVGTPFNYTGKTYLLSLADGELTIGPAEQPIEQMPLPLNLTAGQVVPEFSAKTLDGSTVNFPSDYAGKVVMLDVWALWCAPCIMEIPHMKAAYSDWHEQGFEILGISLDNADSKEKFETFVADQEIQWAQICEGDGIKGRLATKFDVSAVPFALLVDGDTGKILGTVKDLRGAGLSEFVGEQIKMKNRK